MAFLMLQKWASDVTVDNTWSAFGSARVSSCDRPQLLQAISTLKQVRIVSVHAGSTANSPCVHCVSRL
jgi:hypothetical protein